MERITEVSLKQSEILNNIFRFRFLRRQQIQELLNHKHRGRINIWLKDLYDSNYVGKVYNPYHTVDRSSAIYFLKKKGANYIKKAFNINNSYIDKLVQEDKRSNALMDHSIRGADIYLSFYQHARENNHFVEYYTEADLANSNRSTIIKPDAFCLYKTDKGENSCFIEVDLETEMRSTFKRKVKQYIEYFLREEWKKSLNYFPVIGVITLTQRRVDNLTLDTKEVLNEFTNPLIFFKFTTFDEIDRQGIAGTIWKTVNSDTKLDKLL